MKEEKVIRYDSPEAARFVTNMQGWVDAKGYFWGNDSRSEHMARFSSCTIMVCEKCGADYPNHSYCRPCSEKRQIERYNALPKKKWDGETPLYSDAADCWFFDPSELEDYCEEHECIRESLRLVICKPVYAREIESDYFCDELPEDQDLDDVDEELADLLEEVNKYIRKREKPLSWRPGKFAVDPHPTTEAT